MFYTLNRFHWIPVLLHTYQFTHNNQKLCQLVTLCGVLLAPSSLANKE